MAKSKLEEVQCQLQAELSGFGLMAAFTHVASDGVLQTDFFFSQVGAYNSHELISSRKNLQIRDPATLDYFAADRLMAVVANCRDVWEPFLQYVSACDVGSLDNPLDRYSVGCLHKAAAGVTEKTGVQVLLTRSDTETRPFSVIMQAAGHLAGLAAYESSLVWSVHEKVFPHTHIEL